MVIPKRPVPGLADESSCCLHCHCRSYKTERLDDNLKSLEIEVDEALGSSLDEISDDFVYAKPFATYRLG